MHFANINMALNQNLQKPTKSVNVISHDIHVIRDSLSNR